MKINLYIHVLLTIAIVAMLSSCSKESNTDDDNSIKETVLDLDGNIYNTVKICDQIWTRSNLNVSHYRNGDAIPQITNTYQWANLNTGAWCYYNNKSTNGTIYGKLYNWYAVSDPRGLAPDGWHIPSSAESQNLFNCLGGWEIAGSKMKERGTAHWASPNAANNESGFTALPGGGLNSTLPGPSANAVFSKSGYYSDWWTSTHEGSHATAFAVTYNKTNCYNYSTNKTSGFSVRCVKD